MNQGKYNCRGCVGDTYMSEEIKKFTILMSGAVDVIAEKNYGVQ